MAGWQNANQRRQADAAQATVARVRQVLEALGGDIPERLAQAGRLRLGHEQASLAELAAIRGLTKDAYAGRLRRLIKLGERRGVFSDRA